MKKTTQTRKDFPGYPLYPAQDDITHRALRVDKDEEGNNHPAASSAENGNEVDQETEDEEKTSEFDITPEDLEALGPRDLSMDLGEDEELRNRTTPVDFAGEDLDVPGAEADDDQEANGSEDEENNGYSIGGDRHEDLEEDRS